MDWSPTPGGAWLPLASASGNRGVQPASQSRLNRCTFPSTFGLHPHQLSVGTTDRALTSAQASAGFVFPRARLHVGH